MRGRIIARNYAEALFELAVREGSHEATGAALSELARLVEDEPRIRTFLETPKIGAEAKRQVLSDVLGDVAPGTLVRFLKVVLGKDRQGLLPEMAEEYGVLLDDHMGRLHVDVTLAREADEAHAGVVAERLSRVLGKAVVPRMGTNPNIMGGIVVRFGDQVLDGSMKRRLATLRRRMLEADLPLIAASE